MINERKWTILDFAASGRPISELKPPMTEREEAYYKKNKAAADIIKKSLPEGVRFHFAPPNDIDYDESNEEWMR